MNEEIRWRKIPGFNNYEVSDHGQVRNLKGELISQHENKTTKGTYLTVNIHNDDGIRKIRYVHRFVCMAFHGLPENFNELDVNHKDTIKHNNHYLNLEWETRSGNVKHAFITGANKHALAVKCTNILTGEVNNFISMKEVAEFLELGHNKGLHVVLGHLVKPFRGKYVFEVSGDYHPQKRKNAIEVYCIDFKTNTFGRYVNLTQLQLRTGLIKGSVQDILKKPDLRLFNGVVICRVDDKERLFEYVSNLTQEMVNKSIDDYNRYKARKEKLHTT
ncbi:hypothetical protein KTN4_075 [Pseudomonas phage KTN4]|uniref:NUMOD4 domain-containing protein n=1 Tax=Pseudomonas phage KTN4 TaxID=1862701 RepID=A0A192Y510_9CAUD|nr:hypothetical protein KTN4_075 [Pseudomonas phage KTN4]